MKADAAFIMANASPNEDYLHKNRINFLCKNHD